MRVEALKQLKRKRQVSNSAPPSVLVISNRQP
jgi:hypothetical protein